MKTPLRLVSAFALAMTLSAGAAQATVFGGVATFTDLTSGNPLNVVAYPSPLPFTTGNLSPGHSQYFTGFMTPVTSDPAHPFLWQTDIDQVQLVFNWATPTVASTTVNGTVSETVFSIAAWDSGNLTWQNANYTDSNGRYAKSFVTFLDGAVAELDVYNTELTGTTSVLAGSFDIRIREIVGSTNVPEPMSAALFGMGLLGLGTIRIMRKTGSTI